MTRECEVAWAAGLFEGEGYCGVAMRPPRRGRRGGASPAVKLVMTDRDVVERFQAVVGRGKIRSHQPDDGIRKQSWHWQVSARDDVLHVLGMLWPYMGERRRRAATEVIECAVKLRDGDWRSRKRAA